MGLLVSSVVYYRFKGGHLGFESFLISDLESHEDNPNGYAAGAAGTALCGLLLIPAALFLYRRLRFFRSGLALAGFVLFNAGLVATITIACLAPIARDYSPSHIQLAFTAFIGISAGKLIWMVLASSAAAVLRTAHGESRAALRYWTAPYYCFLSLSTSRRTGFSSTTPTFGQVWHFSSGGCAATALRPCGYSSRW
jgi:hypothetical protein